MADRLFLLTSWLLVRRWSYGVAAALRAIGRVSDYWMGHTLPPAGRAIDASGWRPDPHDAYCPRCGGSVGPGERRRDGCGSCREKAAPADGIVRLGVYAGDLRSWVLAIKYRERWTEMAEELGRRLATELVRAGAVRREHAVVVPMPMPWQRRFDRGIDHARAIADGVAHGLGAPVLTPLVKRNGPPQAMLPRSERLRLGRRGLELRRRWRRRQADAEQCAPLAGLDVILVDDVVTTGASLAAAARLMRRLGPRRIIGAVVAVSDERARRERLAERAVAADQAASQRVFERPG